MACSDFGRAIIGGRGRDGRGFCGMGDIGHLNHIGPPIFGQRQHNRPRPPRGRHIKGFVQNARQIFNRLHQIIVFGAVTGMVYSLGYWLEQQGVRRGSQPQYYYLLVIMPFYEFLPVIGSGLAMFAGLNVFWGWRKEDNAARIELKRRERQTFLDGMKPEEAESEDDIVSEIEQPSVAFPNHWGSMHTLS